MVDEISKATTINLPSAKTQITIRIGYWLGGSLLFFFGLLNLADKIAEQPSNELSIAFWSVMSLSLGYFSILLIKKLGKTDLRLINWGVNILFTVLALGIVFIWFNQTNEGVRSFILALDPYIWFWLMGSNFERAVNSKTSAL